MRYYMYAHGGSGNHGCEAIVRSTLKILDYPATTLISSRPEDDIKYGVDCLCNVIKDTNDRYQRISNLHFLKAYMALKINKDYIPMEKLRYEDAFSRVNPGDLAFSIGGDNYCYGDVKKYILMHELMKKRGAKTILWGCSVEPDVIEKSYVAEDLATYNLIAARESISYNALKKVNSNTILITDPAFYLEKKKTALPELFEPGNTVGINLSPMAMENEAVSGITWNNYKALISYIIHDTKMQIALIPHVVWSDGDDRGPLKQLYEDYKNTKRICLIEDHNCEELKYIISNCRYFVGARTHATIAAYSSSVPTLVLGYSVKSRGIARDIFGSEDCYVVSVQSLENDNSILKAFNAIEENENSIKSHIGSSMKSYLDKNQKIRDIIERL